MIYNCATVVAVREVGIRELRQNPGPVLRAVQDEGAEVVISVSRQPVARIVPVDAAPWVSAERAARIYASAPVDADWADELRTGRAQEDIGDPWA